MAARRGREGGGEAHRPVLATLSDAVPSSLEIDDEKVTERENDTHPPRPDLAAVTADPDDPSHSARRPQEGSAPPAEARQGADARDSGEKTPCRMTGVTLQSHVRKKRDVPSFPLSTTSSLPPPASAGEARAPTGAAATVDVRLDEGEVAAPRHGGMRDGPPEGGGGGAPGGGGRGGVGGPGSHGADRAHPAGHSISPQLSSLSPI
jgi:hypothetical protein